MQTIAEWAAKWAIPAEAISDLLQGLHAEPKAKESPKRSEAAVQTSIRLKASEVGARVWRNNVGACVDSKGNHIRYGLANESRQINKHLKSSDLIGIRPVLIDKEHLGSLIGQFIAIECKRSDWTYRGTAREEAQARYLSLVSGMGGLAVFANSENNIFC